ncbi:MAG TPA: C-terminal binding protein [Terriglobia bacterium]|nr:C-terminal binding protein [Terriglobia bacterium]
MSKLRIVITDSSFPNADIERKELAPLDADLITAQCKTEEDVLAVTRDADALMVQWAPITRRVIEHMKHCRFISRYGVGIDMIDLDAAKDHGITVQNVPDFCVEEVASHTLGLLVAMGRKLVWQDQLVHKGVWSVVPTIGPVNRFQGQTLGVVGVGRIGMRFAEMAAPLGFRILAYDIQPPKKLGPVQLTDFDTLLRQSDFVSLHCPLNKETRHLMNAAAFAKMKKGSFFLNVSRGPVVDTQALVDALATGHLAGAALDVFEQEPLPADSPLLKFNNVILTPHLASYSLDAAAQLPRDVARHVTEFFLKG